MKLKKKKAKLQKSQKARSQVYNIATIILLDQDSWERCGRKGQGILVFY
jgi:hypothetical protein